MPYLPSDAEKKSQVYNNIINASSIEYQNKIDDLRKKHQLSGSVDANTPPRDEDGVLVSFESDVKGIALEESFQEVRLENKQRFFTKQVPNEFTFFIPQTQVSETSAAVQVSETTEPASEEQVQFQMNNRDYLIQVVNEYFAEDNDPNISTKLLHSRLVTFFKENKQKGKNAEGWESFRLNPKRKAAGISGKRFKKIIKDLKNFTYDEVIENHLYRTRQGQRIWLRLGFPYVVDQSPDKDS